MSRLHKPKPEWMVRAVVLALYLFSSLMFRIRFQHLDRIPPTGGVILAANHISHVDTVLIARVVWQSGRIPRFMIKSSIFDNPVLGQIMRRSKQIPVSRGTADAAKSLDAARAALDAGEAVVIYPEGTLTKDPAQWPMQAKSGLARLVLLAPDMPVIPIGQWGSQQMPHQGPWHLLRRRVSRTSGRARGSTSGRANRPDGCRGDEPDHDGDPGRGRDAARRGSARALLPTTERGQHTAPKVDGGSRLTPAVPQLCPPARGVRVSFLTAWRSFRLRAAAPTVTRR